MNGERKYTQTEVDQMLEVAREEGREEFGGLVALEAERRWHEVDVFTKADVEQMLEVARAEERAAIAEWLQERGCGRAALLIGLADALLAKRACARAQNSNHQGAHHE